MMLSNGNIVFMDIGNSHQPEYNGDFVTTDMNQYFYDLEMNGKYSSPVDNGNGGTTYDEDRIFGDKSNTTHDDVTEESFTDYRMYSQRFYLPESLRCYSNEDNELICYFWNNTDEAVTLDESYEIQRKNNNKWESVGTGSINSLAVNGGEYAEVSYL